MKFQSKHTTANYEIIELVDGILYQLYSYDTPIAYINVNIQKIGVTQYFEYSSTTKRHLRWFFDDILGLSIGVNDIRNALKNKTKIYNFNVTKIIK